METINKKKAPFPEMKGLRWDINLSGISQEPLGLSVWWKCPTCNIAEKYLCHHSFGDYATLESDMGQARAILGDGTEGGSS
jgi:hypothetical protein